LESLAARQKASAFLDAAAAGQTWAISSRSLIDTDLLLPDVSEYCGEKISAVKLQEVVEVQETKMEPKKENKKVERVDPLAALARSRWA